MQSGRTISRHTPARVMLYVAHFASSACNGAWELVLALACVQAFVDSLWPAAMLVIFASVGELVGRTLASDKDARAQPAQLYGLLAGH